MRNIFFPIIWHSIQLNCFESHYFFQQILDMLEKVDLRPDIVTYGVMAMACINREQAQQFRKKLDEKGIR